MQNLSPRENVLKVYSGEIPDWVPVAERSFSLCMPMAVLSGGPGTALEPGTIIYTILGTPHVIPPDTNIGPMPIPGQPQIPDINNWRKYLKYPFPSIDAMDWSRDIEAAKHVDRENFAVEALVGGTAFSGAPYNAMVDMMGHEGASIAMLTDEEKDSWHELIGFLTDYEVQIITRLIEIYQPDIVCTCDDLATAHGPFMSPATYREMVKPYQRRIIQCIIDAGCIAELHCCGKADYFVDDFVEMGLKAWNPAQIFNDLAEVKAKYGRSFVISGGYDSQGKINVAGAAEADVRASIRDSFAKYAPGGGYIFNTGGMALAHELGEEHMGWIFDEAEKCSQLYY